MSYKNKTFLGYQLAKSKIEIHIAKIIVNYKNKKYFQLSALVQVIVEH